MIKRIFLYMALMMSLAACSDDIFNSPTEELPADGKLSITLTVPEMVRTQTRADGDLYSDDLTKVTMLIFDGNQNSSVLRQQKDISADLAAASDANKATITITVDDNLRDNGNLYFYFIANSAATFSDDLTTIADLRKIDGENIINGSSFVMSGGAKLQELLQMNTVMMKYNCAKVTVKSSDGNTDYPFEVFNAASENALVSGADLILANPEVGQLPDDISNTAAVQYLCPTKNAASPNTKKTFIIVKTSYKMNENQSVEGYYRLDFQKKDGTVLDIEPFHHYEVEITGDPKSPGYATVAEAASNPVSMEDSDWVIIHDHSPKIYNMISDGQRELGVLNKIEFKNGATTATLYVKVLSNKDAKEEDDFGNVNKLAELITFSETWAKATATKKLSDSERAEFEGTNHVINADEEKQEGNSTKPDYNSKGSMYAITVKVDGTNSGLEECTGSVNWRGLSRTFEVVWDSKFQASQVFKSAKTTSTGDLSLSNVDYFDMISENPTGTYKVWGLRAEDNNGEARDNGLHFPMPYGEDDTKATYTHEIALQDLAATLTDGYDWEARFEGDGAILTYVTIDINGKTGLKAEDYSKNARIEGHSAHGQGPTFTLKRTGQDYEYGVGKLIFKVVQTGAEYPINLYHTGFFHQDYDGEYRVANSDDTSTATTQLTYYEVVSFGGAYWLDRNLGAHSCDMYVEETGGTTYAGDARAAGDYFRVADYNCYQKPIMDSERTSAKKICPPGYAVPNQENFEQMRNSSSFTTQQVGNYYTACYTGPAYNKDNTGKTQSVKQVFFPKALYLGAGDAKTGESRSGYYWTSTAASGLEKEEIGNWLKSFALTGSATSYINAQVKGKGGSNGYAMNVRCIMKKNLNTGTPKKTSFFVTGATHVFLYTISKGIPTPITTWPGTPVCTYNGVDNIFNFSYESVTNAPEDLYVIFNYKHSDGKIYSMSKNDDLKIANFDWEKTPSQLEGWHVDGYLVPKYEAYGEESIQDNATTAPGLWTMKVSKKNADGSRSILAKADMKGGYGPYTNETPTPTVKTVTLTIPDYDSSKRYVAYYDEDNSRTHCHHWKSKSETTTWPGDEMNTVVGDDGKTYYYTCIDNHEHLIFSNNGGNKAPNNDVGFEYSADYVYNVSGPNTSLKVVWENKGYDNYVVKVLGTFNGWKTGDEAVPGIDGIAKITSVEIGNTPGAIGADIGAFRIQVWNGEKDTDYSVGSAIDTGKWVNTSNTDSKMWINGAVTGNLYDIEFNVKTHQIKATYVGKVGGDADDEYLTIYFKNNWGKKAPIKVHLWVEDTESGRFTKWEDDPDMTYYKKIDNVDWYQYHVKYDPAKMKYLIIHSTDGWQNKVDYDMTNDIKTSKTVKYQSLWQDSTDKLEFLGNGAPD